MLSSSSTNAKDFSAEKHTVLLNNKGESQLSLSSVMTVLRIVVLVESSDPNIPEHWGSADQDANYVAKSHHAYYILGRYCTIFLRVTRL